MNFDHTTENISAASGPIKINGLPTIAAYSSVAVHTANGYGSTNNKIRRFTTIQQNIGTDITYADSATLGGSFTVNTSGIYSMSYSDMFNNISAAGISLNTTTPTTALANIAASERLCTDTTAAADFSCSSSVTMYLAAGDVIRLHTNGTASGTAPAATRFFIARVA